MQRQEAIRQGAIKIVLLAGDKYFEQNLAQLRRLLSGNQHYPATVWAEPVVDGSAYVCKNVRMLARDGWFGYTMTALGREIRVESGRVERVTFYLPRGK